MPGPAKANAFIVASGSPGDGPIGEAEQGSIRAMHVGHSHGVSREMPHAADSDDELAANPDPMRPAFADAAKTLAPDIADEEAEDACAAK